MVRTGARRLIKRDDDNSGGGRKWLTSEYLFRVELPIEWDISKSFHKCLHGFWSEQPES